MGTQYPANLSGWCGTNDQFLDGVYSSVPGDSACGGLTLVNAPVGDGSLALFYDQSGRIWSIMRWRSAPPCEGACELTCVAGGAPTTSVTKCVPSVELECGV